jgi:hypothetical protein
MRTKLARRGARPANQLRAVPFAGVDNVPAASAVLAPTRRHDGFGTVVGLAVGIVHEAVAAARSELQAPA